MKNSLRRWLGDAALVLIVAELVLVLLSWLLSAMMTDGVRPLLSSEGIRWFFSHFTDWMASPVLVWMLLLSMAGGSMARSGVLSRRTYRERYALRFALVLLLVYVVLVIVLTVSPHAVLLSATGRLFPSPFSRALVPIVAFGVLLVAVTFGLVSGRFRSPSDVLSSLSYGVAWSAPLYVLYILLLQFYESVHYVFSI